MVRFGVLASVCFSLTACGEDEPPPPPPPKPPRVPTQTCFSPDGLGNPQTAEDVVRLINALPRPVTIPCFLEALERPIVVEASRSIQSAQPAFGPNNPRFLIHRNDGDLVLSAVPKGEGRPVLELSVRTSPGRSIKGEILFPVSEELPLDAAYSRIAFEDKGTKCVHCHIGEEPALDAEAPGGFISFRLETLRRNRVEPEYIEWAYDNCDIDREPDRCAMFDAILGFGEVVHIPVQDSPVEQGVPTE